VNRNAALLLALALLASPLAADVHPNTAGGFPTDKAFTVGDLDNVNLFNGALTLTLPIGQSYPVNAFSYRIQLVYNSNPWMSEQINQLDESRGGYFDFTASKPNPCSNAGLGWRLSFGRIDPVCQIPDSGQPYKPVYQDETGTDHVFYPTLHPPPAQGGPVEVAESNVFYSRDGTYLRMKVLDLPSPYDPALVTRWEVHFPDGTIREFDAYGRPKTIRDPFGNSLTITYTTEVVAGVSRPAWRLTDSLGRVHKVVFRTDLAPLGYPEVVDYVELQTFGGSRSKYQLSYSSPSIGRACPHDYTRGDLMGSFSLSVQVPLLTSVGLPDSSSYSMAASEYLTAIPPAVPDSDLISPRCTDNAGSLLALHLPTGGAFGWTWQTYWFPTSSSNKKHAQRNPGIATRSTYDIGGGLLGTWTYQRPQFPVAGNEIINTVFDPLGNKTERYFVTQMGAPNGYAPGDLYDYGQPFTGDVGNASKTQTQADGIVLYLSSRVWENTGTVAQPNLVLRRSEYARYRRDIVTGTMAPDTTNGNHASLRSRTVYEDDGGRFSDVVKSDFDGLGHYRVTGELTGSFAGAASRQRTDAYNSAQGTYAVNYNTNLLNPVSNPFTMLASSSPWQLEKPASVRTDQTAVVGGFVESEMTELCYANNAPVVTRQRVHRLDGATQSGSDLVVSRNLDGTGNVLNELFYGGDNQAVFPTGGVDLCSMSLSGSPDYQINHTYAGGVRATSRYQGFNSYLLFQTLDVSTGLPTTNRDASDLQTSYSYDALSRLLTARPEAGHGAWVDITYTPFNPATNAAAVATVQRRDNGVAIGPPLTNDQTLFDGLGRVKREFHRVPTNVDAKRDTTYDSVGNRATVTEWFTGTSPSGTTSFQQYDPFGRVGKIVPPDGGTHAVTMSYAGARQVSRTVSTATAAGGAEQSATTTETYDRYGRLIQVDEPSGSAGALTSTKYDYDAGSRLKSVSTTSAGTNQNRFFNYDRAGLLQSETHPEKGISGNGSVTYPKYDSKGHLLRKIDGPNDLTYTYDRAERLTQVRETGGAQRVLKAFTWADANANFTDPISGGTCFDRKQGKVSQQSRFNYVTIFGSPYTVEIREGLNYCARDGRLSRKGLENYVNGAVNETFYWPSFVYDALGNLTTEAYPQCTHAACGAPSPRTIQNTYTNGELTQVGIPGTPGSYANAITYHPNGMINQVTHANTPSISSTWLTDTYALDPNGMGRPASITTATSGGVQRWATGTYAYDGAGNIKAMGTQSFGYDKVSRLTQANLYLEPTSSVNLRTQSFTYDAFGNLQSIAGSVTRNTPTSATTNRLTGAAVYDAAGNLTSWNGSLYEYDPFNLMWHYKSATASDEWVYLYTADDERVWSYKADNTSLWTLREPGAKVLREYTTAPSWAVQSDYIYRNGLLLAAETSSGLRHFHLDHLGTPRLVSDATGLQRAYHVYYPYGEEATVFNQDTIREKFTGHERDLANLGGAGDDLDYMHARFCSPLTGRFLSVDPKSRYRATKTPQLWSRYGYAASNPASYLDPDGRELRLGTGSPDRALLAARLMVPGSMRNAVNLGTNKGGDRIITVDNASRSNDLIFKTLQRVVNSPGIVQLNLLPASSSFNIKTPEGAIHNLPGLQGLFKGATLPSEGTRIGNELAFSPLKGVTQILMNQALSPDQQAAVLAAELGTHALPALLGKGAAISDPETHDETEQVFIDAARHNAAQKQ
jgi:RHS repeat-associated protein